MVDVVLEENLLKFYFCYCYTHFKIYRQSKTQQIKVIQTYRQLIFALILKKYYDVKQTNESIFLIIKFYCKNILQN